MLTHPHNTAILVHGGNYSSDDPLTEETTIPSPYSHQYGLLMYQFNVIIECSRECYVWKEVVYFLYENIHA